MDTSYTAVEYFLSFFGSWRDGQDPAVLSLTTKPLRQQTTTRYTALSTTNWKEVVVRWKYEAHMDFKRSCVSFSWFFCSHALRIRKPDGRQRAMCVLGLSLENYLRWQSTLLQIRPLAACLQPVERKSTDDRTAGSDSFQENAQCHT